MANIACIHEVIDQFGNTMVGGIGTRGYDTCMKFIDKHGDAYNDGHYMYNALDFYPESESAPVLKQNALLEFVWDMCPEEFDAIRKAEIHEDDDSGLRNYSGLRTYCGALFVGNLKFEIWINSLGHKYIDVIAFDIEDSDGVFTEYTEDNIPYVFIDEIEVPLPERRTFDSFMRATERNVMDLFRRYPGFLILADQKTDPIRWYHGRESDFGVDRFVLRNFRMKGEN